MRFLLKHNPQELLTLIFTVLLVLLVFGALCWFSVYYLSRMSYHPHVERLFSQHLGHSSA